MNRLAGALAAGVAALGVPFVVFPSAVGAAGAAATTPIQHLVVMTQGGRTFDNYFGTRTGVDGIPDHVCQLPSRLSQPTCVPPTAMRADSTRRPARSTAIAQVNSIDRGAMNGFVRAQTTRESDGTDAMGYYRAGQLPLLNELADRGVLFDHWFSGVPGGTVANRLFDLTAQPPAGDPTAVPTAGWKDTPVIFDRLTAAGVSWKVYVQNYEPALTSVTASTKQRLGGQVARVPLLALARYRDDPQLGSHVVDLSQYYRDASSAHLPAVSYIVSTSATEQAPQSPTKGNRLARAVVNSLIASPAWPRSAFLLQYDSSGGWYDHVQPPRISGRTVGLRVPALLISPYARGGTIDHRTFDAASVLGFIERTWQVMPLAQRDRDAGDLRSAFAFTRKPTPAALIGVPDDHNVRQPDRTLLYAGYGSALTVAVVVVIGVALSSTLAGRRRAAGVA